VDVYIRAFAKTLPLQIDAVGDVDMNTSAEDTHKVVDRLLRARTE